MTYKVPKWVYCTINNGEDGIINRDQIVSIEETTKGLLITTTYALQGNGEYGAGYVEGLIPGMTLRQLRGLAEKESGND